ncbi:MAG: hypothetical protein ACK46O_09260 [Flavobacteriia bacterium]|jgi:hypothetical protein
MKQFFQKPINVFFAVMLVLALPLFTLPLNLFKGELVRTQTVVMKTVDVTEKVPLSLSYFIGFGYNEEDMEGIKDFYLLPEGWILAIIFIVGIPALVAYRVYLKNSQKEE